MRESERRLAQGRILDVVRAIRWRWRARQLLRGLMWTAALTALVVFASAVALERLRFAPEWVVALRFLTWGTLAVSGFLFLVRPLLRRVSDHQVALYLEEHEPSLEHAMVSALADESKSISPTLRHRVVESAIERARQVDFGRRIEQSKLYRFAGALSAVAVLALTATLLGPEHLRHGLGALLLPTRDAATVNPYSIAVTPGDVTIPRNSDQMIAAALGGFDASDVSIFTRGASEQGFRRLSMVPGLDGSFEALLLGVAEETEYFVESTGVRSPTFRIEVADLPYVDRMDLTYHFPSYTGMSPRVVENGGDVAALPGTVIEIRIEPTMLAPGGRLLLDSEEAGALELQNDGTFITRFTVGDDRFYSIELARENGALVPASPEYTIDLLDDQEPSLRFSEPGRDETASPIEEFYLEVSATDDYGVRDLRIVYSVNAGEEDTVSVFRTSGRPLAEVSAGHTLFLEEWELEPGDLVSYYAIARDNRPGTPREVESEMYFLNIRPFEAAYRQSEQGGGGGGGGAGMEELDLSELQRQIISATFNLVRQRDSYTPGEFEENVVSVGLAQGRLRDQVATLLQRMQNRGLTDSDPGFRDVSSVLPLAVEAMERAQADLAEQELREALPDEQEALRYLQQAEQTYERYVTQQQQGGGGGGSAQQRQAAEDLADLFELELDKLKNQYETVQRGQQQQADNQVDELLEQLQELARRQEQEAERQRRRAQQTGGQSSTGGSQSQRDLAEETEEAARQLQRLAREMNDRQMEETARDLQQAAEAMRQSAAQSGSASQSQASSALQRLEEARRQLMDSRSERARRDAEEALETVEQLQRQQRDVQQDVRNLPTERGPGRAQEISDLRERKDQMHEAVANLERALDQAASNGRADNPQAARALQDAANQIRESKLREKIQYSRGTIEEWDPQTAVTLELDIESDLQNLRDQLARARDAASERIEDPLQQALDEARQLVRGMEAMERRLAEAGEQDGQQQGQPQDGQSQDGQSQDGQSQDGQQPGQQDGGSPQGGFGPRDYTAYGGPSDGVPRRLTPEELRQYRNEFDQRADQVRELRNSLREAGRPVDELDGVLETLDRLGREGFTADPGALAMVQADMVDRLKRIEFGLRREIEGESNRRATLTGTDEVPDGYRNLVEEYYRSLARGADGPSGG